MTSLTISVIVPTWKRPQKLFTCLEHLHRQIRRADQLLVVVRREDTEALLIIEQFSKLMPELQKVFTEKPGVVAAENAGLRQASGELIAFIDDDGYAPEDWLVRIEKFFQEHPEAGAYGGADLIKSEPWTYHDFPVDVVGEITWFGKIIGNHHRKCTGGIRRVDVLKGVNMVFKRNSFSFLDEKLAGIEGHLGNGSQWELDLCLTLRKNNLPVFFDPHLLVIHDSDHSRHDKLIAGMNNAHNLSYVMAKHLKAFDYILFFFYALIVGNEQLPGVIKASLDCLKSKNFFPVKLYGYKLKGFFSGIKTRWI